MLRLLVLVICAGKLHKLQRVSSILKGLPVTYTIFFQAELLATMLGNASGLWTECPWPLASLGVSTDYLA